MGCRGMSLERFGFLYIDNAVALQGLARLRHDEGGDAAYQNRDVSRFY